MTLLKHNLKINTQNFQRFSEILQASPYKYMHVVLNLAHYLKTGSLPTATTKHNQISHMNDGYILTTCKILKIKILVFC